MTTGTTRAQQDGGMQPVLKDDQLYLCDNGACYCGAHCGISARYTGRDRSGQRVHRVTAKDARLMADISASGSEPACEKCGRQRKAESRKSNPTRLTNANQ